MSDWISVSARLPEEGDAVLVCGREKRISGCYWREWWQVSVATYHDDGSWHNNLNSKDCPWEVTHWMPMPSLHEEPLKANAELAEHYRRQQYLRSV